MKRDPNRPRRREPYHYDVEASVYLASILAILQRGQSIPMRVLQMVYRLLLPYGPGGSLKK